MKPYFSDSDCTIYHADARDLIAEIDADALITDPPYGLDLGNHAGAKSKAKRELRRQGYDVYDDTADNYERIVVPIIARALERVTRGAVFATAPSCWRLPAPTAMGGIFVPAANGRTSWGFQNLSALLLYGRSAHLCAGIGGRNTMTVGKGRAEVELGHPCPKPMPWLRFAVALASLPGETVLDPFMGSGTTLRAAKDAGRKSIGIEISERYCEIAANRLRQQCLFSSNDDDESHEQLELAK